MKQATVSSISRYLFLVLVCYACNNKPGKQTATETAADDTTAVAGSSLKLSYYRGPYQVNGASPWYGIITIGSRGQVMKVGYDSGDNAIWLTSSQCTTAACTQPGRARFTYYASTTFSWIDSALGSKDFGPWGNMVVNIGQDMFNPTFNPNFGYVKTLLSVNYSGPSFAELDWDGGISFPSQAPDSRTTWMLLQLVNKGLVNPNNVCVSFYMDDQLKAGMVQIGNWSPSLVDTMSRLRCSFKPYNNYNGSLNYLWSTAFGGWSINGQLISDDTTYVFDTGASDFKGDTVATDAAIRAITNYYKSNGSYPTMELAMGVDRNGNAGKMLLTDQQYVQKVEAGPGKGTSVIAIDTLDIPGMVLAGSVVLEDLYTVFWYKATGSPGNYTLTPVETWLFNKKNGPSIIQKSQGN